MRSLLERKRQVHPVHVGGETYYVKSLTLSERLHLGELHREKKGGTFAAKILRVAVCDADGNDVFTDDDLPALESLEDGNAGYLLASKALELNRLSADSVDEEKKD